MGDRKYSRRAEIGERCSSVEEQVVCLIDHATDPNILGRTWQGWELGSNYKPNVYILASIINIIFYCEIDIISCDVFRVTINQLICTSH